MTRFFNKKEIDEIISYVTTNEHFVKYYRSQLCNVLVYPEIISKLKEVLKEKHNDCLVKPREPVGIICAQSIGERFTRSNLNTFHKAGIVNQITTKGLPRVQELLNVSKNPKS